MLPQVQAILSRAELVRQELLREVESLSAAELEFRPEGRWSVRDVLIHLTTCDEAGVRVVSLFQKGEEPPREEMLPPDEWNARELAKHADLDGAGALRFLAEARAKFVAVAASVSAEQLANGKPILESLGMTPDHEAGHLCQIREVLAEYRGDQTGVALNGLAYARRQILPILNLEGRATESVEWRPEPGAWSIREILLHLAVWDRFLAGTYAAIADGRPVSETPYPEGELDRWNQEQVAALSWMSLAEAIHELGAARGAVEAQIRRLTPEQWQHEWAPAWRVNRKHDLDHMQAMYDRLRGWRKA